MYDLWFTLGSAIINPALLDAITAVGGVFTPVFQRQITETDNTGKQTFISTNSKTAGLLDNIQTSTARIAIRDFLLNSNVPAPPISIYTAGRMSQLVTLPNINFDTLIRDKTSGGASGAYADAAKAFPAPYSAAFPAVLGLALIDGTLLSLIPTPGNANLVAVMQEFGLSADLKSPERQALSMATADKRFTDASASLLSGTASSDTPWQDLCSDQLFFWDTQNARAVL
jgi:hypothetical protein